MDPPPPHSPGRSSSFDKKAASYISASSLSKSISDGTSQSFFSILNNPNPSSSIVSWWPSSTTVPFPEFVPVPSTPRPGSELTRSDFLPYISAIAESHSHFVDILRQHDRDQEGDSFSSGGAAGKALVACLREVPAFYFKEDFQLEDGATFRAACPFVTTSENIALQEKLSHYLDVVELHLVREISMRSSSFFEAQEKLEDLNSMVVQGCERVRELIEIIRLLDSDLVGSARRVQDLSMKRGDMITLQNKLRIILSVNQAVSTLQLLVASADCLGALDIADDLQQLLDRDELIGLHCFRHIQDHLSTSLNSVNGILSAEFIHVSLHGPGGVDMSLPATSGVSNGTYDETSFAKVKLEEEHKSIFHEQLLPLVIGLLRTGKLPSVLRVYRDTLASDLRTSVKIRVLSMPIDPDTISGEGIAETDGGSSSLGSKLKSLSPDRFLKLLEEIFKIVQARLLWASEVKRAIEWIMGNLSGHYAAASVAAAIEHGASFPGTADDINVQASSFPLQSSEDGTRMVSVQGRGYDNAVPNLSKNFRADILRENAEALFAACDAAHGRWAKIVGIRSQIHTKLRLQEFLGVYKLSQEFISSTEKIGGRLGYSIRGTLQSQAKSFLEFQHEARMNKMRALLNQENWSEIDTPEEFQTIVNSLCSSQGVDDEEGNREPVYTSSSANEVFSTSNDSYITNNSAMGMSLPSEQPASNGTVLDHVPITDASRVSMDNSSSDVSTSQLNSSSKDRKPNLRMLYFRGVGYHMVNCGLYLVKMMSEYIDISNSLPTLSAEVVHRVAEILKLFNSRTAHLVLGANALQVSGLRSITSRHLALASQVISFTYSLIPEIRTVLLLKVPETYKGLLQLEIDRVSADYKNHRDEIHSKLVQIMRERLLVHLRSLPQIVEGWNRSEDSDVQPSQFARSLTKEVGYLLRTLSKLLLDEDVRAIFGEVVVMLDTQISDAFSKLEISSPHARTSVACDVEHLLACIRSLPSDKSSKSSPPNSGLLDQLLEKMQVQSKERGN